MPLQPVNYVYQASLAAGTVAAAGTLGMPGSPVILAGAVTFYASDIFVARERFVKPGFDNTIIGLPLYYAGVTLLALSVLATGAAG